MLVISKDLESKVETVVLWQQRFDLGSNGLILSWSNDLLRGCVILPKSFQNQQIGWWSDGWPPIQKTDSSAIRWPFCWGTPRCGASAKIGSSRSTGQRYGQLRYWWSALNLSCSENFHKPTGFWCRQSARRSFLRCWWTKPAPLEIHWQPHHKKSLSSNHIQSTGAGFCLSTVSHMLNDTHNCFSCGCLVFTPPLLDQLQNTLLVGLPFQTVVRLWPEIEHCYSFKWN